MAAVGTQEQFRQEHTGSGPTIARPTSPSRHRSASSSVIWPTDSPSWRFMSSDAVSPRPLVRSERSECTHDGDEIDDLLQEGTHHCG